MQRRHFLRQAGAGLALPALGLPAGAARAAGEPLKVGFIYPGPVSDVGWTYQHDLGRKMVEAEFGAKVKTVFVEKVPEGPDAERVIRQLVDDGCGMVFTTSFGFMEPTVRVAPDYPNVAFEHCSGYKMAANVGIYQTRFYEGAYLMGMLAGKRTKSNTLGYVAPFPIPEVIRNLNAFVLGARAVNPKVTAKVVWISSWYDPPREREAAQAWGLLTPREQAALRREGPRARRKPQPGWLPGEDLQRRARAFSSQPEGKAIRQRPLGVAPLARISMRAARRALIGRWRMAFAACSLGVNRPQSTRARM